ncbi:MAG: type II toxin-antitoxin system Phd/YefM family antitoxin [Verrucomicrobia bacterium]|jgi:prevent-host-death family protein|nr:type II toxin-antitoxin system Phd/YefM family antitoxin [Verrucomicrobiota bacterium]MBT7066450.1 type II toxin-antitoxin system Phd/YefM family antitoxin [Verrucomicrobiota bacterium]MBT7700644.1 type II toxin-antitoxin system Phd/YefM family antitoxin [Verrucomicrobiota bacterium]
MEATMLDLRRNTKRVLKAIDDREHVTLTHRGKKKAVIVPYDDERQRPSAAEHPAFGMWRTRKDAADVNAFVRDLRKGRPC